MVLAAVAATAVAATATGFEIVRGNASCLPQWDESVPAIPTEWNTLQLLQKRPLDARIQYLAVPWTTALNKRRVQETVTCVAAELLRGRAAGRHCFTVVQHIRWQSVLGELKRLNCLVLFTPHTTEQSVTAAHGITVAGYPHAALNSALPAAVKDVSIFFSGLSQSRPRKLMEGLKSIVFPADAVFSIRDQWGASSPDNNYRTTMARARFALCPRGTGPSTVRLFEAMKAAAVPVVYADGFTFPAAGHFDWTECAVRIPEREAGSTLERLGNISSERAKQMGESCRAAFLAFFGEENLVGPIRYYFKSTSLRS